MQLPWRPGTGWAAAIGGCGSARVRLRPGTDVGPGSTLAENRRRPEAGAGRKQALAGSLARRRSLAPVRNPAQLWNRPPRPTLFWRGVAVQGYVSMKAVLSLLGIVFVIAWLVLWLAVKVTFGAIHLLVVIGVILIIFALVKVI